MAMISLSSFCCFVVTVDGSVVFFSPSFLAYLHLSHALNMVYTFERLKSGENENVDSPLKKTDPKVDSEKMRLQNLVDSSFIYTWRRELSSAYP